MANEVDLIMLAELQEMVQNADIQIDEAVEEKKSFVFAQRERQKQEIADYKEQKRILQQKHADVTDLQKSSSKVAQKQASELGSLQTELAGVKQSEATSVSNKGRLEAELSTLLKEKQAVEESLVEKGQGASARKKEMTKGLSFYKDRLGLEFERVDEDTLRFIFTYVDPDNWSRPFSCAVFVDKENKYQVPECEPMVRHDDILRTLNESNDFSGFIRSIRRRFQDHVGN